MVPVEIKIDMGDGREYSIYPNANRIENKHGRSITDKALARRIQIAALRVLEHSFNCYDKTGSFETLVEQAIKPP